MKKLIYYLFILGRVFFITVLILGILLFAMSLSLSTKGRYYEFFFFKSQCHVYGSSGIGVILTIAGFSIQHWFKEQIKKIKFKIKNE